MKRQRGAILGTLGVYAVLALVVCGALVGAYLHVEGKGYDRGIEKCRKDAQVQRDKEAKQGAGASTKLEAGNAKAKVVYRTITQKVDKIVEKPVYRNICLEPDGLLAVNAALTGALAPPREPNAAVPKPDAPTGWFRGLRSKKAD